MVDKDSATWLAVAKALAAEKQTAIDNLIADRQSEKQRGKLELITKVLSLANPVDRDPIVQDTYS